MARGILPPPERIRSGAIPERIQSGSGADPARPARTHGVECPRGPSRPASEPARVAWRPGGPGGAGSGLKTGRGGSSYCGARQPEARGDRWVRGPRGPRGRDLPAEAVISTGTNLWPRRMGTRARCTPKIISQNQTWILELISDKVATFIVRGISRAAPCHCVTVTESLSLCHSH